MTVARWIRGLPVGVVQAIVGAFDIGSSAALTAGGTTQANSPQLPRDCNVVTTCAGGAGFTLPYGVDQQPVAASNQFGVVELGDTIKVINHATGNPCLVWPATATGTIQGGGGGASFSVANNKEATFTYIGSGNWTANLSA